MTPFSDLLNLFQLEASVYNNAKFCGDWLVEEHKLGQTCFHMAIEGGFTLNVPGHFDTRLECGDLVIFPYELPHSMHPVACVNFVSEHVQYPQAKQVEGTGILCGTLNFQHVGSHRVLDLLPPVFVIRHDASTPWLALILKLILTESHHENSLVLINKLCELLFIHALRHFLQTHDKPLGFLSLYTHDKVGKAIATMHQAPEREWNLQQLASIAGLSRTQFVDTFKKLSGWTVMQYLTWWRMQLAWLKLVQGESVLSVALAVGYQSEAAFSRAFKKVFSKTPGHVRRSR